MPGTIIFKPIEANLNLGSDVLSKADPYCQFTINGQQIKSQVCKSGGKHPVWEDSISVPATFQPTCFVELKDKDLLKDERLGSFEVDLREIESQGRLKKWYPIFHKDKPAGEILLEAVYAPQTVHTQGTAIPIQQTIQTQPVLVQSQAIPVQSHTVIPVQTMGIPANTTSTTMYSQGMMGAPISRTIVGAPVVTETVTHTAPLTKEISVTETPFQIPNASQTVQHTVKETVIVPGMHQSIPIQPVQQVPYMSMTDTALLNPSMTESLSEYYAREALIRGVDPLGTRVYTGHSVPLNTIPLTQSVGAPGFIPQSQYLPEQQLLGQTGLRAQQPGQPALITSQNLPGPSQIPPKQL